MLIPGNPSRVAGLQQTRCESPGPPVPRIAARPGRVSQSRDQGPLAPLKFPPWVTGPGERRWEVRPCPMAQLAAQRIVNPMVPGSSPGGAANTQPMPRELGACQGGDVGDLGQARGNTCDDPPGARAYGAMDSAPAYEAGGRGSSPRRPTVALRCATVRNPCTEGNVNALSTAKDGHDRGCSRSRTCVPRVVVVSIGNTSVFQTEVGGSSPPGRTEGGAQWWATGLENQATVTREGSTPSPSSLHHQVQTGHRSSLREGSPVSRKGVIAQWTAHQLPKLAVAGSSPAGATCPEVAKSTTHTWLII